MIIGLALSGAVFASAITGTYLITNLALAGLSEGISFARSNRRD